MGSVKRACLQPAAIPSRSGKRPAQASTPLPGDPVFANGVSWHVAKVASQLQLSVGCDRAAFNSTFQHVVEHNDFSGSAIACLYLEAVVMLFDAALTAAGLKTIGWNAAVSFFSLAHEVVYVEQKKCVLYSSEDFGRPPRYLHASPMLSPGWPCTVYPNVTPMSSTLMMRRCVGSPRYQTLASVLLYTNAAEVSRLGLGECRLHSRSVRRVTRTTVYRATRVRQPLIEGHV